MAYLKSENTGIIRFEDFEVSYNNKTNKYTIKVFIYRGTEYIFELEYDKAVRDGSDVAYVYNGIRSNFMNERVVVFTRTKLSAYLKNSGFISLEDINNFDQQAISFIFPKTYLIFSIAPIKNTPEAHQKKEEKRREREAKILAQRKAQNILEKLLPICKESLKDSIRQDAIKEFFNHSGKMPGWKSYIALIDTTLQVTIIRKSDNIYNETLYSEWIKCKSEYEEDNGDVKVINGKVFLCKSFDLDKYIKIQKNVCSVRYNKKTDSYIYYSEPYKSNSFDESNQIAAPKEIKEVIENNLKKKGIYSLYWQTLGGKLVSISYIKHGFMENNYDRTPLYSIYE